MNGLPATSALYIAVAGCLVPPPWSSMAIPSCLLLRLLSNGSWVQNSYPLKAL